MSAIPRAQIESSWKAVVQRRRALLYSEGSDTTLDRPAHVRAASSIAWFGNRLAVVQDDANFIALVDPTSGLTEGVPLPDVAAGVRQFDDRRGNKHLKLDLEACVAIPSAQGARVVALASGSTPSRHHVVQLEDAGAGPPRTTLLAAPGLYQQLQAHAWFADRAMNIEGAVVVGGALRLLARGNGSEAGRQGARNATLDVPLAAFATWLHAPDGPWPELVGDVSPYDLGTLGGVSLGFTDAVVLGGERLLYVASAEASPDVTTDGEVTGSVLGVIEPGAPPRYAILVDAAGAPLAEKVEGVALCPGDPGVLYLVIDADDPTRPSELCEVSIAGGWT